VVLQVTTACRAGAADGQEAESCYGRCTCVVSSRRFGSSNCILVNVYLPCVGSVNRPFICDIIAEIDAWCQYYDNCNLVIAADFNTDLDTSDTVSQSVYTFIKRYALLYCDQQFGTGRHPTYVNLALKQQSCFDYILVSPGCDVSEFSVVDPDINFSDHLPLYVAMKCSISKPVDKSRGQTIITQRQLRWDKADSVSYYYYTGLLLNPLLEKLDKASKDYDNGDIANTDVTTLVENVYCEIADILTACAKNFVPERKKSFYKFGGTKNSSF